MAPAGDESGLWNRALGFLTWDAEETLLRQESLLLQALQPRKRGGPARRLLRGYRITGIDDLREVAPLTTYETYAEDFAERRRIAGRRRRQRWLMTSGRPEGGPKWIPLAAEAESELAWLALAFL